MWLDQKRKTVQGKYKLFEYVLNSVTKIKEFKAKCLSLKREET